jgi:hypothetical protein
MLFSSYVHFNNILIGRRWSPKSLFPTDFKTSSFYAFTSQSNVWTESVFKRHRVRAYTLYVQTTYRVILC